MPDKIVRDFFGIPVEMINFDMLMQNIVSAIASGSRTTISYANLNTLNVLYKNVQLHELYSGFTIIHQDGVGVYLASKFLYAKNALANRLTGSDFYEYAKDYFAESPHRLFFFGDTEENLSAIREHSPRLNIVGLQNGYTFDDAQVIQSVNESNCDVLFVGLGSPKQEIWVQENKAKLNVPVIICVGDGIKVFCGKKVRGPIWAQKAGLEWFFRFIHDPVRLWKRYIIGIPLFFLRVFRIKVFTRKDVR